MSTVASVKLAKNFDLLRWVFPCSGEAEKKIREAIGSARIEVRAVALPAADPVIFAAACEAVGGSDFHIRLAAMAATWLAGEGKFSLFEWRPTDYDGRADVVAIDGSVIVECGRIRSQAIKKFSSALSLPGRVLVIVPHHPVGVPVCAYCFSAPEGFTVCCEPDPKKIETQLVAFRLTKKDLEIINGAQMAFGLATRTEALRYILRQWKKCKDEAWEEEEDEPWSSSLP